MQRWQAPDKLKVFPVRTNEPATTKLKPIRFLRHAESMANAGHATEHPATIPLTADGAKAASRAAEEYDGPEPEVIVVSPYLRAQMTAAPFISRFPRARCEGGLPVHEFTYLCPAKCSMTTEGDRRPLVDAYWKMADASAVDGPGAESFNGFIERVAASIDTMRRWDAAVLVVGHGLFIGAAQLLFGGVDGRAEAVTMPAFRRHVRANPMPNLGLWELPAASES